MFADYRIFFTQICSGVDDGLSSQQNLHHTDHMRINKQRNADLQYAA